jgi:seryl-tRNA synthetase
MQLIFLAAGFAAAAVLYGLVKFVQFYWELKSLKTDSRELRARLNEISGQIGTIQSSNIDLIFSEVGELNKTIDANFLRLDNEDRKLAEKLSYYTKYTHDGYDNSNKQNSTCESESNVVQTIIKG